MTHHKEEEERRPELFIPGTRRAPKGITRVVLLWGTELPTAGRPTGARTGGKEEEGGGWENGRGRRARPSPVGKGSKMGREREGRALKGLPQPKANTRPRREGRAARTRRPEVKQDGYRTFQKRHYENTCTTRCSNTGHLQEVAPRRC